MLIAMTVVPRCWDAGGASRCQLVVANGGALLPPLAQPQAFWKGLPTATLHGEPRVGLLDASYGPPDLTSGRLRAMPQRPGSDFPLLGTDARAAHVFSS